MPGINCAVISEAKKSIFFAQRAVHNREKYYEIEPIAGIESETCGYFVTKCTFLMDSFRFSSFERSQIHA